MEFRVEFNPCPVHRKGCESEAMFSILEFNPCPVSNSIHAPGYPPISPAFFCDFAYFNVIYTIRIAEATA